MKILNASVLFILFVLIYSCQQTEPAVTTVPYVSKTKPVSVDTFNDWTAIWKRSGSGYLDTMAMKYFKIPEGDLKALAHSHPHGAHFYLGLDSLGVGRNGQNHYMPHLFMIGLNKNGTENQSLILDYTRICPPRCND